MLFFNLYPRHRSAAAALIRIGDSYRRGGLRDYAELFYKIVARDYGYMPEEALARLRLAELGQERVKGATEHPLQLEVKTLFREMHDAPLTPAQQERTFRTFFQNHRQDALGSEALFYLAEHVAVTEQPERAIPLFREVSDREGQVAGDPWPREARRRLTSLMGAKLAAAVQARDDWQAVTLFHRHGRYAGTMYAGTEVAVQIAHTHRQLGNTDEAVKQYQALLRDQRNLPFKQDVLIGLGRAYLDQGDPVAARMVLDRYRLEYPLGSLKADALLALAETWRQIGNHLAVIRTCWQWLKLNPIKSIRVPGHQQILLMLAKAEEATGATDEAVRVYAMAEQAGVLQPLDARIRYADLLAQAKQLDPAVARYQEVIRQAPESDEAGWAQVQMAKIRTSQKRYADARAILRQSEPVAEESVMRRFIAAKQRELDLYPVPSGR
jgi:tetratricopeptide (TPR) repeat protein